MILYYPLKGIGKIPGIYITQLFGDNPQMYSNYKGHMGVDFGCPVGTPVYASHSGVISFFEDPNGYGHHIYNTDLTNDFQTIYAHLSSYVGSPRQVMFGELIGYSGNTGNSTGPHLHFGLQLIPVQLNNGYAGCSDPLPYLKGVMSNVKLIKNGNEWGFYLPATNEQAMIDKAINFGYPLPTSTDGTKVDWSKVKPDITIN